MLVQRLINPSRYNLKCPYDMTPIGICIHNTANDAPAKNELSFMETNESSTSYHIAIDDVEAVQAIPFNRNAFHAGDGRDGEGNRKYIAIEICWSLSGGSKFVAAEQRAAKEIANLLKQYNWSIDKVKTHKDFSGKDCPHRTLKMGWDRFLDMIKAEMNGTSPSAPPSSLPSMKIQDSTNKDLYLKMTDLKKIMGITVYCDPRYFSVDNDGLAYTPPTISLIEDEELNGPNGYHYILDSGSAVYNTIPESKSCNHLKSDDGSNTYINSALYSNNTNQYTLGILMVLPKDILGNPGIDYSYEKLENDMVKFISIKLHENGLTPDNVFRGFDLNEFGSPLHLLEPSRWNRFLSKIQDAYTAMKSEDYTDEVLNERDSSMTEEEFRKFYGEHISDYIDYSKGFKPDDRDLDSIKNPNSPDTSIIDNFERNGLLFAYTTEQMSSNESHCSQAYGVLKAKISSKNLDVEPIYPDIIIPPGGSFVGVDSTDNEAASSMNSTVNLSAEDFEKRNKTFNIKDYKDIQKKTSGRPVNNNDPFPVDDKIKELESHMPKVKIDEVTFKFNDTNHPGSALAKELTKDLGMIQSEIMGLSRRIERRLVCIENTLSTVTRNLFRVSSRMHINCTYYGGQDIFGKFKSIRCLHDDRINDGQSMTLDQCLSCTRYEPIIGQVYAILDESGTTVSQIVDDLQMAYMTVDDYAKLTRIEEMHIEKTISQVNLEVDKIPKRFEEVWDEGFKMDWNDVVLETQKPNIAEYKTEGIEEIKPIQITLDSDGNVVTPEAPEFQDKREDNSEYEEHKYNSDDYEFNGFDYSDITNGTNGNNTGSSILGNATEIRKKIVEYTEYFYDRGQKGTAGYSQPRRNTEVNGILYHDCSSLVARAYKEAGLSFGSYTGDQYPLCYSSVGGKLFPVSQVSDALPGDVVFCGPSSPSDPNQLTNVNSVTHVMIYIGNGMVIEASTANAPITQQIKKRELATKSNAYCFATPKCLVDADKEAATSPQAVSKDLFDIDKQALPTDLRDNIKSKATGWVSSFIQYSSQFDYKPIFTQACKNKGVQYGIEIDPYILMAICSVESSGNPRINKDGLMQIEKTGSILPSSYSANSNEANNFLVKEVEKAIDMLVSKKNAVKSYNSQFDRWDYAIYAYNCGEGTIISTIKRNKLSAPVNMGTFAGMVKEYVASGSSQISGPQIRYEYFARIAWCYTLLLQSNF